MVSIFCVLGDLETSACTPSSLLALYDQALVDTESITRITATDLLEGMCQ